MGASLSPPRNKAGGRAVSGLSHRKSTENHPSVTDPWIRARLNYLSAECSRFAVALSHLVRVGHRCWAVGRPPWRANSISGRFMTISDNGQEPKMSDPDLLSAMVLLPADQSTAEATSVAPLAACAESSLTYTRLIVSRCSQGLLEPFRCAVCGVIALDPIGWNGPGEPLCAACADPVEREK